MVGMDVASVTRARVASVRLAMGRADQPAVRQRRDVESRAPLAPQAEGGAFPSTEEVQMIMLAPSTCQLDQVVYGRDAHQMARFRLIRNEILGPGGVYYVGDFRMSSTS